MFTLHLHAPARRALKCTVALALLLTMVTTPARAEHRCRLSPQQVKDAQELMAAMHLDAVVEDATKTIAESVEQGVREQHPDLSDEQVAVITSEISGVLEEHTGEFAHGLMEMYAERFSHRELTELTRFYRSELGQRVLREGPAMLQETFQLGRAWSESLAPQVQARLEARLAEAPSPRRDS